jgi:predicted NBD/HSP70 family sugar kinase
VPVKRLLELAADGDAATVRLIAEAGRDIGVAVANLCNLINPERVIVGGDLCAAGELITEPIGESIRRYAILSAAEQTSVVPGVLGERAELLGALALVVQPPDRFLASPPTWREVVAA